MRVVYILPISWGGIPHYTAELANAVVKYVDEVIVLKPQDNNTELFSEDIEVKEVFKPIIFSKKNMIKAFSPSNISNFVSFNNIKLIYNLRPDIIHFPELYPHISMLTFIHKIDDRYPIVYTRHTTFESLFDSIKSGRKIHNLFYGMLMCVSDFTKYLVKMRAIVVHTQEDKNKLIKRGIPSDKIFVIPHGAYNLFKKYKKNIQINNNNYKILFFGYILRRKGLEYLIKAEPYISKKVPNVRIIIAGEGDITPYLKYIKNKSKFEIYNKYIPDQMATELFVQSDIVVVPYTFHLGHSGVLTIALSFGKPVVVTNVGDFPNIIRNGVEGFVVPPRDPKALADAIIKILQDDKLRKKMSRNALKRAEELSWDNIAKMHIMVYEKILQQ